MQQNPDNPTPLTQVTVPDNIRCDTRLDAFIASLTPERSRRWCQKGITDGVTLLNGKPCRCSSIVRPGDVVSFDPAPPPHHELVAEEIPLDILHEDEWLLIINKQPGLVVHPATGNPNGTLVNGLLAHDASRFTEMIDERQRPGIVHRLDKDTSGALIIGKDLETCAKLKRMFLEHKIQKVYLSVIIGQMPTPNGRIELQIGRHPYNRVKMTVVSEGGKDAITEYKSIAFARGCSLLKVRIHTGRTHQIRVHLSHFGHPVLGDYLYGGRSARLHYIPPRQMLHAWRITFNHPVTNKPIDIEAPIPDDFIHTLQQYTLPTPTST